MNHHSTVKPPARAPATMRIPPCRWNLKGVQASDLAGLESTRLGAGLPPLIRRLLIQRGFQEEAQIERFLNPKLAELSDPFLLPDMEAAVDRLLQAIEKKERVVLYGDYDVDGVTSLSILTLILREFGLDPVTFLPLRMEEGYGLSTEAMTRLFQEGKPDLLMTVDCGTVSIKEISWLKEQGVDVMILDHHEPLPEGLPPAVAIVNPKRVPQGDFHYFCTAGLAFKMAHALVKKSGRREIDIREYLDLVALGTVSDVVPLKDENRTLVRHGLRKLENTKRPGLKALKEVVRLKGRLQSWHLGFQLGPRLNAAGRLDSADVSLKLVLSEDYQEAKEIAEWLDAQNRERQELQEKAFREAMQEMEETFDPEQHAAVVLGSRSWHPGVVGIVASKLLRLFNRPAIVISFNEDGIGKGSGRSFDGIPLVAAIRNCLDCLIKGGGHDRAAGLSVLEDRFPEFRQRFNEEIRNIATDEVMQPKLIADAECRLGELDLHLMDSYERLEPFGECNPRPLLLVRGVYPSAPPRRIRDRHLLLYLQDEDESRKVAMWYSAPDESKLPPPPWDIAITVNRSRFRDQDEVQIVIEGLRSSAPIQEIHS